MCNRVQEQRGLAQIRDRCADEGTHAGQRPAALPTTRARRLAGCQGRWLWNSLDSIFTTRLTVVQIGLEEADQADQPSASASSSCGFRSKVRSGRAVGKRDFSCDAQCR